MQFIIILFFISLSFLVRGGGSGFCLTFVSVVSGRVDIGTTVLLLIAINRNCNPRRTVSCPRLYAVQTDLVVCITTGALRLSVGAFCLIDV